MAAPHSKQPNPHEPALGRFLRALARPIGKGYVQLRTGQILREETAERWRAEGRTR